MKNLFLFFLLVLLSCKKNASKVVVIKKQTSQLSIVKKHLQTISLDTFSIEKINNWKEYHILKKIMSRFKNISANEALSNALELNGIVKKLKDSIKPKILKIPAFKARVDVLENETLRLADMTYISEITANEVNNQVTKILAVYSSMNRKINTVFSQKRFEDAINIDDFVIGLDSTKIDSFSKKSVYRELKKRKEYTPSSKNYKL